MLTTAHLFSGGGGDTEGAIAAGYKPLWAIEADKVAAAIYRYRFPHVTLVEADIITLSDSFIRCLPVPGLLIGGSPCQDLSVAGSRAGISGSRSSLFFEFVRCLRLLQPRAFIFENVPGLLSTGGGRDFETVIRSFAQLGYMGSWQVRSGQRWIPQNRKRVFIVGIRQRAITNTHTEQADAARVLGITRDYSRPSR